ncbi:MAG: bi-domain-containing oxidoreductase [Pseudomonadota bacterium]|nr:bi-domain-containing oxidoreductase [Pseudomonadota bacterium]
MKQILQNLKDGSTELAEVPCPRVADGELLIRTSRTLVSAGTERMLVDFGKANLLDKARQQPDKVRMVLDKVRTDGLMPTLETVRNKLDQPLPLGYCNAGTVIAVGEGVDGFRVGDRVASNGKHAEIVRVPKNLCAKVPDGVSDESAAFAVVGAIALQGIRLVQPTLGETVVVTGLGLIGLVAVQLLRANGCRVLGIDPDPEKVAMARRFGAEAVDLSAGEDPLKAAESFSRGRGVDAVVITASTKSSEPVSQAARMCRKRGRIVLVGVTGLELSRADFFEKELSFQVSCSYGPGRYDPGYEDKGHDYPVGFVRWTEQRNLEAVLDMMASGALDVGPLISHRYSIDEALKAYELLGSGESALGILLDYPGRGDEELPGGRTVQLDGSPPHPNPLPPGERGQEGGRGSRKEVPVVGFVGAGNYAGQVLIPAFKAGGAVLRTVASSGGVSGVHFGRKHGFRKATTDTSSIFSDDGINTVVVATRHDSHARFVLDALGAGKHVFVEKPLALTLDEVGEIEKGYEKVVSPLTPALSRGEREKGRAPLLMVGFNRRFAPQVRKIRTLLESVSAAKSFVMTVNAGEIPPDHWTQDPEVGGGRIIGEACHFIDLLRYLAATPITDWQATFMGPQLGLAVTGDKVTITLTFTDGSFGVVHYLANGHKSFPKERLEVFCAGRVLQLDNFRRLTGYGWPGFRKMNLRRQDKGQKACAAAFLDAVREGRESPIPVDQVLEVSRISIEIAESQKLRSGVDRLPSMEAVS